jgi:hypothetical protein
LAFWRKSTNTPTFTNGSEHWALTSDGPMTWTGANIDPPVASSLPPVSNSALFLVAPQGLPSFSGLPVRDIEEDASGYKVVYGMNGGPSAVVSGHAGRDNGPQFTHCVPTALNCTDNILGRDDTRPASEIFRGLLVNGLPAYVTHITCCNGLYWIVSWYEPTADVTYELSLEQDVARPYGDAISPSNVGLARQLASLAAQLVPSLGASAT